jgi:endoglucanase
MSALRPRLLPAVAATVAVLLAVGVAGCSDGGEEDSKPTAAVAAAKDFLHDYVTAEGAVVRRDQGGDVVSEGQGYAMLLAVALDDPRRFAKIWGWTRSHLQRPDELFAFHWDGAVVDDTPAADADTQIAWALALAGERWSLPADTTAARRIAEAIAEREIGYDDEGHPTLGAGPWAVKRGQPVQVEPGYWTFPAYAALAKLTGDHRWEALSGTDTAHLRDLSRDGAKLPADWATVGSSAGAEPISAPNTGAPPASGQDGLRALVWAACQPATHDLAADWWHAISATAQDGPLTRGLDGDPMAGGPSPLSLVAAAAVAKASDDDAAAGTLLRRAQRTAASHPTYYGSAWNALGQILLTTTRLPGCTP